MFTGNRAHRNKVWNVLGFSFLSAIRLTKVRDVGWKFRLVFSLLQRTGSGSLKKKKSILTGLLGCIHQHDCLGPSIRPQSANLLLHSYTPGWRPATSGRLADTQLLL